MYTPVRHDSSELAFFTETLGCRLAEEGTAPVEVELAYLVRLARRHQVALISADVLADCRQPEVARLRAYSRIVSALSAATATPAMALAG